MKNTTVAELMTTDVVTLEKEQAIPLAQEMMRMLHIRHLPVVQEDSGELVGLVTHRSLLAAQVELLEDIVGEESERELSMPVARVMATDIKTVKPQTTAAEALELMLDQKLGSLPVIENGDVIGIVTSKDFLELALRNLSNEGDLPNAPPIARAPPSATGFSWAIIALLLVIIAMLASMMMASRTGQAAPATISGSSEPFSTAPRDKKTRNTPRDEAAPPRKAAMKSETVRKRPAKPANRSPRKTTKPAAASDVSSSPAAPPDSYDSGDPAPVSPDAGDAGDDANDDDGTRRKWVPEPIPQNW